MTSRAPNASRRARPSAPSSRRSRRQTGDEAAAGRPRRRPTSSPTVRAARGRWQREIAARGVDRDRAQALDQRFAAAFEPAPRRLAGRVRRHRSRSRRQPQADGDARAAHRGSRRIARPRLRVGRRGDVADDPARRDAQGSARREHHRRQGGRRQPLARGRGGGASGAGRLDAHRRWCPTPSAARSPTASSARASEAGWQEGRKAVGPLLPFCLLFAFLPFCLSAFHHWIGSAPRRRRACRTAGPGPCRRASRESRSASSRLRPSAAALRSIRRSRCSAGTSPASPRTTELSNILPSVVHPV